ncbi:MAG: metallophosphatase [Lachnospiraceae bacterium]|nr:metallophosphatase [Lachnospiraceae bacterium]
MLYLTGDTHGLHDVRKITGFMDKHGFEEGDRLIVLGDFGVCWDGGKYDGEVRRFWEETGVDVFFVDGNHENHDLLAALPESEMFGGKVHRLGEHMAHLMRGQVFEFDGKTLFTMGGAQSHDVGKWMEDAIKKHLDDYFSHDFREDWKWIPPSGQWRCRQPGRSWWAGEIPDPEEIRRAKENLTAHGNRVDYVLTHTSPSMVYRHLGYNPLEHPWGKPLLEFLDWVEENVEFKAWYFGHHHQDFTFDDRHYCLYDSFVGIG